MNAAQSHASLLLLAVLGVPWLIDRAFTWLEDNAAYGRRLECRVEMAAWDVRLEKCYARRKMGKPWDEIVRESYRDASPSL